MAVPTRAFVFTVLVSEAQITCPIWAAIDAAGVNGSCLELRLDLTMLRFNGLINRIGANSCGRTLFWFNDEQWAKIQPLCQPTSPGLGAAMIGAS
jgi:hypothetical protein